MSKSKDIHDPESVSSFIENLEPEFSKFVAQIRQNILKASNEISEQIKWNSPSFFYNGAMKPFDPKAYKRDIVVMNLRKNEVLLVFPTGNTIDDKSGLLEGDYADGRRLVKFTNLADFETKKKDLQFVIKDWISRIEK